MRNIFRRSRAGQPFEGTPCYCSDPLLVRWPGAYAVTQDRNGHDIPDPKTPLLFEDGIWKHAR